MKLLELLSRYEWLKLQQLLVEVGFTVKLVDQDHLTLTAAYKDRSFKGLISYYEPKPGLAAITEPRFTVGNTQRPVNDKIDGSKPNALQDVVNSAALLFLEHITTGDDGSSDNFDWLDEKQTTDFVTHLLEGKVYEALGVDPGAERAMIKHYESKGWTLFLNSEGEYSSAATGETMLIFLK
jgi:hypothetical protein